MWKNTGAANTFSNAPLSPACNPTCSSAGWPGFGQINRQKGYLKNRTGIWQSNLTFASTLALPCHTPVLSSIENNLAGYECCPSPNGKGYLKFQVAFWLGITPPAGSLLFGEVGLVSLTCGLQFGYGYPTKSSMSQSCLSYGCCPGCWIFESGIRVSGSLCFSRSSSTEQYGKTPARQSRWNLRGRAYRRGRVSCCPSL